MLLPLVLIDANKHGSLKSLGPWITYWRRVPPLIRNNHFGLCMSSIIFQLLNIFVLFCFSAVSPPNYSMQKCALLNTHMALLTGSDHVTHFKPWNVRGSLLGDLRKMSVFLIKGTSMAGNSFLQQPFLPSWRKGQENNRSVSPDRHQLLKPMPATTYLQTSCCMRKINHYLLKPLR